MAPQPSRRLLIFQEARNPQNTAEVIYLPVNKLGLPISGPGPELPSILELPLRILRAFTEIFNQPKYKGWYVFVFSYWPSQTRCQEAQNRSSTDWEQGYHVCRTLP
jgi:hypothetical protein